MGDIETRQIEELERTHPEPRRIAHDPIHVHRLGDPFAEDRERLCGVSPAGVVDKEPGRVHRPHRLVAESFGDGGKRIACVRARALAGDHLDHPHQGNRVEEMEAGDALGVLAR